MAQFLTPIILQMSDGSANPLSGAKLYIYAVGTTTELSLFSNDTLTTPLSNPIVADSAGVFASAFLAETEFKAVLTSSADVTLYTRERVYSIGASDQLAAENVSFDGSEVGMAATNVQNALLELTLSTTSPTTTQGDTIFRGASTDQRLAKGTLHAVMTQAANAPQWSVWNEAFYWTEVSPTTGDYNAARNVPYAGTITKVTTICATGTCTLTVKINSTALGGTPNAVSNVEEEQSHSSDNTFAAGDNIFINLSSIAAAQYVAVTVEYTRTF